MITLCLDKYENCDIYRGKACKRYNMKKVAIVAQGLGDGGAERVASILANGLSKYYTVLFVAAYSSDKEYVLNDHVQYTYIDVSAKNGIERLEKRNKRIVTLEMRLSARARGFESHLLRQQSL